ncbi:MAG TPA: hypothetical protein VN903_01420 [Polyangia bacterium]|nr:hypothetical protein [Polyangia bacterium]
MLTRTLATLTLLLALASGTNPAPRADTHLDGVRAAHRARLADVDDDIGGCREAPPSPVPSAAATCSDEGQP